MQHPAVGDGSATVYGQAQTSVQPGDTLTVLADPKRPDHAEISGSPYYPAASWIKGLLFTIVAGFITVVVSRKAVIMFLRHRRVSADQKRRRR